VIKKLSAVAAVSVLAFPFVHPFGPVREQNSTSPLPGPAPLERACQNCHSERTRWPPYSRLPGVSWALEKDVAEGRQHMNLSRWPQYSTDQKRDILARIGAKIRSHQMPPTRYTLLHPNARLSDADIREIYEWTKTERRALRDTHQ
jgi:hypothetical protein